VSATEQKQAMEAAIASEAEIADRAKEIRKGESSLTESLFMDLWPLLCKPIPEGFLSTVPKTTGKPYDSTGVRSVQVQIDRMNNVLSPPWWNDRVEYHENGKLAHVTIVVGYSSMNLMPVLTREAWGGVDRGSTLGNVYKGSYTNAAKLAFARVGPGHEIYIGTTDFDPDVNKQVAKAASTAQGDAKPVGVLGRRKVQEAISGAGKDEQGLLTAVGLEKIEDLTVGSAKAIRQILDGGEK
jgi:hypothetical protein